MDGLATESWACGECGAVVGGEVVFGWCDGCAKVLCTACLDEAVTCERCDLLVCRDCALKRFAVECAACGAALHVDCVQRSGGPHAHPLCATCCQSAAAMWG